MSVIQCDKEGCDNIMSEYESQKHGYLCEQCYETLVASGPNTNIEKFMGKTPTWSLERERKAEQRYSKVFKRRDEG